MSHPLHHSFHSLHVIRFRITRAAIFVTRGVLANILPFFAGWRQLKSQKLIGAYPFPKSKTKKLITLYLENKENYHEKFKSGSKTGESQRQKLLAEWSKELTNLGFAFRSPQSIEEKIRNETKKVQRFLREEKEKYGGTGGGVYVLRKLPPHLHPLADALAEKHHVSGIPGINDASGDEGVAMDDTEQSLLDEETNQADKDAADVADIPGPSQESQESQEVAAASSRPYVTDQHRHRSMTATAREALSLFSDKRTQLYEEEIKVARLKQKKLQLEIQVAELKKEEAKVLVESAKARYNATTPTSPRTQRPSTGSPTSKYMQYYSI